jgi:hypothetical protein
MGSVHFTPKMDGTIKSYLWRSPFPANVTHQLVWHDNPRGRINSSDLELAGSVVQHNILCQLVNVANVIVHNCYDNTATVFWQRKGSATTVGPAEYFLGLQVLHQRHYRYAPLHDYIPGSVNMMADVTTRSWELSKALLAHFECRFPHMLPWMLCQLRNPMSSALTSALLTKRYKLELLFNEPNPKTSIGRGGTNFSSTTTSTHSYTAGKTLSRSSKYLDITIRTTFPPKEARQSSNSGGRTMCGRPGVRPGGVIRCPK